MPLAKALAACPSFFVAPGSLRVSDEAPPLSSRELETLRWTLAGKTAWEVGGILGIAENTVVRHVHRATRKLGCHSKHQAAVKALRLGLIG